MSKLAAEYLLRVWAARTGTPLSVLRLSHVYGPGDTSDKAIPNFLRACLRGETPRVSGDGSDTRDWVYVDDVVNAIITSLTRQAVGTWNIAGGTGTSTRQMLNAVRRLADSAAEPIWQPATRRATHVVLDIARAYTDLGWAPRVGLEDGLRRTVTAFRNAGHD